jgi:hypothetical protein
VLRGTVLQTASSSVAEVEPAADTVVVRIDEVLHGAPAFEEYAGEPVTVQLPEGVTVGDGEEHVFHVVAWIFGTGLAVRALSLSDAAPHEAAQLRSRFVDDSLGALRQRAQSADRVVSGVVTQVSDVPPAPDRPISEHDPMWHDAVVQVRDDYGRRAARRKAPAKVTVRFASSRDVRWQQAPKFVVGDQGLWMLGAPQPPAAGVAAAAEELPADHYLVVDPDDFHPMQDAPAVLAALDEGQGES